MSAYEPPKKTPSGDWDRRYIRYRLEMVGYSLSRLSLEHFDSRHTLKTALDRPYPKSERIIAGKIGVDPWVIWPSRYPTNCSARKLA